MRNKYIENFEKIQTESKNIPDFRAGDTVKVAVRIKEGDKTRVQNFEGLCIAIRGQGTGRTFMVRKIGANSVGVERIFPLYSESIESIEVVRKGRVRRAKLFYLRDLKGKAARIKELRRK
ncbi:MAG: 50S ribosomal protein L19 [Sulfurovum sp.]|nr:50S ribosomal protein L19 [Sulfurovum sp.]MCB4745024.1 50S ribosomal protein L19 [Sulfurovum sp.]MCB4746530.1 50S ribosomal protein L19 [Sulfurovum sp.]MCB4747246.1 50S ribosomal protein L19 [Sulfurovum sp.]MCB4748807.1 50S ribosomal protein L19 [Sulfurovum sp.]